MVNSIRWHGHSNFLISTPNCKLVIDPFFTHNPKAPFKWEELEQVDAVLVTHLHDDHLGDAVDICLKYNAKLVCMFGFADYLLERGLPTSLICNGGGFNIGGTVSVKDVKITMVEAFHSSLLGAPAGYIITLPNSYTIYHSGDTAVFENMKLWGELYPIDLALLPIGGIYTMDARQAVKACQLLNTKMVVPMHYGTFPALEQSPQEFLDRMKKDMPSCICKIINPGETMTL